MRNTVIAYDAESDMISDILQLFPILTYFPIYAGSLIQTLLPIFVFSLIITFFGTIEVITHPYRFVNNHVALYESFFAYDRLGITLTRFSEQITNFLERLN